MALKVPAVRVPGLLVVANKSAGHCCPLEVHNVAHQPGRSARGLDKAKPATGKLKRDAGNSKWGWRCGEPMSAGGSRGWPQGQECFGATSRLVSHAQTGCQPTGSEKGR